MDIESENVETAKPLYTRVGGALAALGVLGIVILITTRQPGKGGPITILLFLGLLFISCIGLALLFAELVFKLFKAKRFSSLRLFYTTVLISLAVVFIVGLQTLGQLQLIDVVLIIIFELLLNFYLLRRF